MRKQIKKSIRQIKNVYGLWKSRPLPQTEQEVLAVAELVCKLGGFPSNDSFIHAACTQLMHMDSSVDSLRIKDFVQSLRRSICNQSAFGVMQDIKARKPDETLPKV